MKTIDKSLIVDLIQKASDSPRKRAHYNLHPELKDPVQRLCVVANEGSYIRPHRHAESYKWEMFIVLQGSASVLSFDDKGVVIGRRELSTKDGNFGIEIPPQAWHTLVITSSKTVLMEIKPGPYYPLADKDFAQWAPEENCEEAVRFEKLLCKATVGTMVKL